MKLIVAIIRPDKLNDVLESLYRAEVKGLTVSRVLGHGARAHLDGAAHALVLVRRLERDRRRRDRGAADRARAGVTGVVEHLELGSRVPRLLAFVGDVKEDAAVTALGGELPAAVARVFCTAAGVAERSILLAEASIAGAGSDVVVDEAALPPETDGAGAPTFLTGTSCRMRPSSEITSSCC